MNKWQTVLAGAFVGSVAYVVFDYLTANPNDTTNSTLIDLVAKLYNITGTMMKTSQAGKTAIMQREGVRLAVYADTAGYLTAGIGHKLTPMDGGLSEGDSITQAQLDEWFAADLSHAENTVEYFVKVPLSQAQYDALVSATFNLGSRFYKNINGTPTDILSYLNAGDYASAAKQFPRWVYAGGVVDAGLLARRQSEEQQFLA